MKNQKKKVNNKYIRKKKYDTRLCVCDRENQIKIETPKETFCFVCFRTIRTHTRIPSILKKSPDGKVFEGKDRTREAVRQRDNYTCQDCLKIWGLGERRFDVHHLNGLCGKKSLKYDRISEINGLVTLCHKCHFNRPEHTLQKKKFSPILV